MKYFLITGILAGLTGCYSQQVTQCVSKKSTFHDIDGFYTLYSTLGCTLMVEEQDWRATKIGDSVTSPYWH